MPCGNICNDGMVGNMLKIRLVPSIERADWLALGSELRKLEEAKADLLHIDILDTSYGDTILMSPKLIPAICAATAIPLDIHISVGRPAHLLDALLPYCKNSYIDIQIETTMQITSLLKRVRNAGGKPAVTLNPGTSLSLLEELVPYVDMVNLMIRTFSVPEPELDRQILDKITRTRRMFDEHGRRDVSIEVDGSLNFNDARQVVQQGADVLVLGTKTAFRPGHTYAENCQELRGYLRTA